MDAPPPPPPPPHGANPKTTSGSGLPPGNYDIFIIPPHSSGSGFLYLPSLQPQWNSFIAGAMSSLGCVWLWFTVQSSVKHWFSQVASSGGPGVIVLVIGVGVLGWAWGKTQYDKGNAKDGSAGSGRPGGSSGWSGFQSSGPPPQQNGFPGGAPPPHSPPGGQGHHYHQQNQYQQHRSPPTPPFEADAEEPPKPGPSAEWEKARAETRKREEQKRREEDVKRRQEAEKKKKEEAERQARAAAEKGKWEKMRQREKEVREREARERIAREKAQKVQEAKDAQERAAAELKAKLEKDIRDKLAEEKRQEEELRRKIEEEARLKREAEEAAKLKEKEAADAAKKKLDAERAERLRVARERVEKLAKEKAAAAEKAKGGASFGKGERTDPYAGSVYGGQRTSPTKPNYEKPSAKSYIGTEDEYSFRPYDKPRRGAPSAMSGSQAYSEQSSYAASESTARTTPPPSQRGAYCTSDPEKIVIRGVYMFNDLFPKPIAQLVSGVGHVTDGLILRVTTEGLFIDDDVRGVPQREWDTKAWTLKSFEVGERASRRIIRASVKDANNKKLIFVISEDEQAKIQPAIARLKKSALIRSLSTSNMSPAESKKILEQLGYL